MLKLESYEKFHSSEEYELDSIIKKEFPKSKRYISNVRGWGDISNWLFDYKGYSIKIEFSYEGGKGLKIYVNNEFTYGYEYISYEYTYSRLDNYIDNSIDYFKNVVKSRQRREKIKSRLSEIDKEDLYMIFNDLIDLDIIPHFSIRYSDEYIVILFHNENLSGKDYFTNQVIFYQILGKAILQIESIYDDIVIKWRNDKILWEIKLIPTV